MSRTKAVIKNAIWELSYYLIVILFGFLAPRYIILVYGSEVNGLTSTITQILNIILILQAGATTAAIFSLYKPIAENNLIEISKNIYSIKIFFRKISFVFATIMVAASFASVLLIDSSLDKKFIFIAFIIMGLKSFFDLYFTSTLRIVFTAFQEKFIISIGTLIEQVLYYCLIFFSIYHRMHFIYLYLWLLIGSMIKILYLEIIYRRKYGKIIHQHCEGCTAHINGRLYALANEISHSVVASSMAIIMSFMYGLQETSVYSVYAMAVQGLTLITSSLYSAFAPSFGNLVSSEKNESVASVFIIFQFLFVIFNTVIFLSMTILVAPFAGIYTSGSSDINYVNPLLASLIGLSAICSAYRIPYNIVVSTYGFFKETWKQPVVCAFFALLISLTLGKLNFTFILIGQIFFYVTNFVYQYVCLKRLVNYLISDKIITMFLGTIFGFIISAYIATKVPMELGVINWIITAIICFIIISVFTLIYFKCFLPNEYKITLEYFIALLSRRPKNV